MARVLLLCAAVLSLCSHGVHAGSRWASAPVRERGEPPYPYPSDRKYKTGALSIARAGRRVLVWDVFPPFCARCCAAVVH